MVLKQQDSLPNFQIALGRAIQKEQLLRHHVERVRGVESVPVEEESAVESKDPAPIRARLRDKMLIDLLIVAVKVHGSSDGIFPLNQPHAMGPPPTTPGSI